MLDNYIFDHNAEGQFAGDIEYAATCKLYNIRIVLLIKGFVGYNVYNIFMDQIYNIENTNTIYLLFINNNHFN